ncbi:hypothetical protein Tco_0834216 [Tanacetum coccineum]
MHRNIAWDKVENLNPQSTPQVLPSFEEYTPPVTYPEEVEETLGTPIEVEPLDETQLEDLGLNTCNHDIPLSSREVPSFDKTKPQPQPLPTCPPLDISLGDKRGLEPPIKPHSPDSFRMKEVDHLTNNTPPSPHVASFHPKDTYCHYHPCIGDPKKHYGFKPGLLGLSGSLGVDFSKLGMIENDWELESKEVSFLGRGLNSPVRPKEVENVRIKETHRLEHKIQQILFQHMAPSRHHGVYHYYHPHLNSSVGEPSPLSGNAHGHKNIVAISHDEKEELRKKGIKSPSNLFSLKYISPASIKELNKKPSTPKRVYFVNSIVILSIHSDTEEDDTSSTNAHEHKLDDMKTRNEWIEEHGKEDDEIETDIEIEEAIEDEESEFKTDEEVKERF